MLNSIDKNRGTHGDSSFMLDGLPSSRENPLPLGMGMSAGEMYPNIPPEHSKESIKRRCVQIRQELLMVMKELK